MFVKKFLLKHEENKILEAIEMIKLGILERLEHKYELMYEREIAEYLSAAVVKELFCEQPMEPYARQFLETNKHLIDKEMANLKFDENICRIITLAIHFKSTLSSSQKVENCQSLNNHIEKLTQLGIYLPAESTPIQKVFYQIAAQFKNETY